MNILLTGGAGYIGSYTTVLLIEAGHNVVLFDNLSNSRPDVVDRLKKITQQDILFIVGDVRDTALLSKTIKAHKVDAVIHFAGLKAVGESVEKPLEYFDNNVGGTISLLRAMQESQVNSLVFSSRATVYGEPQYLTMDEDHPTSSTNPYGRTKLHIEEILQDLARSDIDYRVACLRYFNPVGAHESALIGEDPAGVPNNLMPYVAQVAAGKLKFLNIYGDDYPTADGTVIRDYIHVMDLASGHLSAINFLNQSSGCHFFNLGTGSGFSVLEMVKAFERAGDVASCYADVNKAKRDLSWESSFDLNDMYVSG